MSIPVLTQVYDEMRRLAVAGSVVAGGDFRLKKLIQPLEQSGAKAPVFAKVAQAVKTLVDSNEKTSALALLELSTLVNAILYTQGETGLAGKLEPIETTDLGQQKSQASAKVLKPLLEALSTTGSGRHEIIKDSHERGAFRDLRLVKPALFALDDPYSEIGDYVAENVLPIYGKAILPELKSKFDMKAKHGGALRRLKLMHHLDPEGTRPLVKQALEEGSKEIKVVAIECLGDAVEDLSFLLEQAKAKAKDVRQAALNALSKSNEKEALEVLQKALTTADIELAVRALRDNRNPQLLKFILSEAEGQLQTLLTTKDKKAVGKQVERMCSLLQCLGGRDDQGTEAFFLKCFAQRDAIAAVKGEPSGQDVVNMVSDLLIYSTPAAQKELVDAHATLSAELLSDAFVAARKSRTPKEVYDLFSPYLLATADTKKKSDPKRDAIYEALSDNWRYRRYWGHHHRDNEEQLAQLDPRWLDAAVKLKSLDLVRNLARPGHDGANEMLEQAFTASFKKAKDLHDCTDILETMVQVQHPRAVDSFLEVLKKHGKGKSHYGAYWLGRLIPDLPKSALASLEELLPTLDDKVIDTLMDYVTALRNKE